jgi:hypothetical protein
MYFDLERFGFLFDGRLTLVVVCVADVKVLSSNDVFTSGSLGEDQKSEMSDSIGFMEFEDSNMDSKKLELTLQEPSKNQVPVSQEHQYPQFHLER